jgi:general secretion pathway protein K
MGAVRRVRSRGFALIPTLWVVAGVSSLALTSAANARDAIGASRNRASADRAYWLARGCAERLRHDLYHSLWPDGFDAAHVMQVWESLDRAVSVSAGCQIAMHPSGMRADVNLTDASGLRSLLRELRVPVAKADSMTDAFMDWRDSDDMPRPNGAERDWYSSERRPLPRNGPFLTADEVRLVRGFEQASIHNFFGVAEERVLWTRASRPVLASLPGMTAAALDVFEGRRGFIADLLQLASFPEMPAFARDTLERRSDQLAVRITTRPQRWDAHIRAGGPPVHADIRLQLSLGDRRLFLVDAVAAP